MNIIAIANISNGRETIGFRLLEVNTKEVKDLPSKYIRVMLIKNIITINNLKVKDGKVVGSSGSIDRLPKIVNGQLVGKSPLIILEQVGDKGYNVSDFNGKVIYLSNKQVIKYGRQHGISNGKIIKKGESEFISAITGSYTVVKENTDRYTGSLVPSMKELNNILLYDNDESRLEIYYKEGKHHVNNIEKHINASEIKKNMVYENDKYTMHSHYIKNLRVSNDEDREEIMRLLEYGIVKRDIDNAIKSMKSSRGSYKLRIDTKTGILIPTTEMKYDNIDCSHLDTIEVAYEKLDITKYKEFKSLEDYKRVYMEYLRIMDIGLCMQINLDSQNLVLYRECSEEGIVYTVIPKDYYIGYSLITGACVLEVDYRKQHLEYIYYNHSEYDNVIVEGKIMQIRGLDGVYRYDMDKIHSLYGRHVFKSNTSLKYNALGQGGNEIIDSKGRLYHIDNSCDEIIISKEVREILPRSISIDSNDKIIFGDSIERCDRKCFKDGCGNVNRGINYIEIRSNRAYKDVVEAIYEIEPTTGHKDKQFNFTFDVTPEYIVDNIYYRNFTVDTVLVNGKEDYLTDEFIDKIIDYTIRTKLNNLDITTREEIEKYDGDINRLIYRWDEDLRHRVSYEYRVQMDKIIFGFEEAYNDMRSNIV